MFNIMKGDIVLYIIKHSKLISNVGAEGAHIFSLLSPASIKPQVLSEINFN